MESAHFILLAAFLMLEVCYEGRRNFAAVLGFFETVVYIWAVATVLLNMNQQYMPLPMA